MIETVEDFQKFLAESDGEWIVHVVPLEEEIHPAENSPSIIFIRIISTGKTYYYAWNHPDSRPTLSQKVFAGGLYETENHKWALDRKSFNQLFRLRNVYDANFCGFLRKNEIFEFHEFDTAAHGLIRGNSNGTKGLNRIIPLMKHLEAFNDLCDAILKMRCNLDRSTLLVNEGLIETLGFLEMAGIYVNREKFCKYFPIQPNDQNMVYSQYNLYTSTGRPSNRYRGVNYAALNSKDGSRAAFVSRFGKNGRIVVVDYTAFHPRIICMLTGYEMPVTTNIYEYLAKLYYQKKIVDDIDIAEAKGLTFRQLYGGVEDKYAHIKYLGNLRNFIQEQWEFFQKNGFILTPIFKRKITDKHLTDPNPAKVFNYILQAVEGEIAIPRLQEVQRYLASKQTRAILYTYDAVLYDFHKDDGLETLNHIREIMSFDGKFPMKTYIGDSYQTVKQVNL